MVYPILEAATPPPLVQSFPAPVLTSDAIHPALSRSSETESDTAEQKSQQADSLGPALSIPPSTETISFTTDPALSPASLQSTPLPQIGLRHKQVFERAAPATTVYASNAGLAQRPEPSTVPADIPVLAPAAPEPSPGTVSTPSDVPPSASPASSVPERPSFVELSADRQEYETLERSVTAIGNVLLNYRNAQLKADRVRTLATTKQVFAEGNVRLTVGQQVLQGDRLEYQLDQESGVLFKPRGIINLPSIGNDFSNRTPGTNATGSNPLTPLPDRFQQPLQLKSTPGLQRLRFEADRIEFTAKSWRAVNIRITSDPFSPPELELRANQAELTHLSNREDIVKLQRPRLVFDQSISVPIPRSKIELGRQRQNPFRVDIGFDDIDRGGLYLGSTLMPFSDPKFSLAITPQFFLQRALLDRGFDLLSPDLYGLNVSFKSTFSPQTTLSGFVSLSSLDVTNLANTTRAGLRLTQKLDAYRLDLETAYRERVLNGSLGEQEIQNRVGGILTAPTQRLGKTGIQLNYRVSGELITAGTDRFGGIQNETLGRLQGSASLQKAFDLWKGTVLPATATEGLRYTPEPIQPHFSLIAGATGVFSGYSNGDTQTSLIGNIRFEGQIGHFSRPYLDYTGFFVGFSQGAQIGQSPFLFDRVVDLQTLSFGFLQQVYGPVRLGFQTSVNLETGEFFNTDIILDYSRRTYGLSLRYNPNLQLGAIEFHINSFNWVSNPSSINAPDVGVVEAGVNQTNDPF